MYDPTRRSDPHARDKADSTLVIAAERAQLEARVELLERSLRTRDETARALRQTISALREENRRLRSRK